MAAVPLQRTTFTPTDFAHALIVAWEHELGHPPTKAQAGIIYAQWALETGKGSACWNFNIGNVKVTEAQAAAGVPYFMLPNTWEIIGGKKVVFQPPHPATWFRAFASLDDGMTEHLRFLRNTRYTPAWPAVEAGDPDAFAADLKRLGYYTAPVEAYARLMRAFHAEWMRSSAFDDATRDLSAATTPTPSAAADGTTPSVEVLCQGVRWLVAPAYIAPVGIGEASALATKRGCELPSPALVDAIWLAADLKVDPIPMSPNRGDDAAQAAEHQSKVDAQIGGRPFRLLAGTNKDVVRGPDGLIGLYGWHRLNGKPIQPFFAGHAPSWKDYSQGLRLVRRIAPAGPDVTTVRGYQARLAELGFDPGPIDGVRGPRTVAAVRAFQRARGLVVDGVVGPQTRAALTSPVP